MFKDNNQNQATSGYVYVPPVEEVCPGCGYCKQCGRYVGIPPIKPVITWTTGTAGGVGVK